MKNITYGIFAEDEANKIFIRNAIPQLINFLGFSDKIALEHEEDFTDMAVAKNGEYVNNHFVSTVSIGIKRFGLNLCFIGLDADDNSHISYYNEMMERAKNAGLENAVLIYIPVQAIEYWLWYIKAKKETPALTNTTNIENEKRRTMKFRIYNRKRAGNKISNPIVEKLSKNIDFEWLNQHSTSFKHFYDVFENYLKENAT